jgi:hypothetical protein
VSFRVVNFFFFFLLRVTHTYIKIEVLVCDREGGLVFTIIQKKNY